MIKLETFYSSYFLVKRGFEDDGLFNVLMFWYFKKIGNTDHIFAWKSKGFSD